MFASSTFNRKKDDRQSPDQPGAVDQAEAREEARKSKLHPAASNSELQHYRRVLERMRSMHRDKYAKKDTGSMAAASHELRRRTQWQMPSDGAGVGHTSNYVVQTRGRELMDLSSGNQG